MILFHKGVENAYTFKNTFNNIKKTNLYIFKQKRGVFYPFMCYSVVLLSNQYSASIASRMRRISLPFSAVSRAARRSDLDMKSVR
tara:strand:+ start:109 stop:363 length:255 start_codon:yes stop_codon:yes gene_type:complete